MSYSLEQEVSPYSFKTFFKSFKTKKLPLTNLLEKLPLLIAKPINHNSILLKTITTTSSKPASTTLDSNYFRVAKTLQAIRHRVKINNQLNQLPQTMKSYGLESLRQLTKQKKQKELPFATDSITLSEFLSESKEICLKNLLIKIIKTESNRIEEKEVNIAKALDTEKSNLENDQSLFDEYSERKRKSFREVERNLLEIEKNHKQLFLNVKEIRHESEVIKEEIKKYVALIEKDRQYALFLSSLLKGGQPELFKVELKQPEDLIKHYGNFLKANPTYDDILDDPNQLIKKSEEFEDLIVRMLLQREVIDNQYEIITSDHHKALIELTKREEELTIEHYKYLNDYQRLASDYNKLHSSLSPRMRDSEISIMIQDLHRDLFSSGENNAYYSLDTKRRLKNGTKTILDLTKDCNEKLKGIEVMLNEIIRKLTRYETDTKVFNSVIFKRKHMLKDLKQMEYKKKMESLQKKRREQAEERANRIVIKSRKTQAPFILNKKIEQVFEDSNEIKEIENNELIHYH